MNTDPDPRLALATLACRAGQVQTAELENSEPIFPSSSFCFENAAQAAARFSGAEAGNVYSRFTNPTVRNFEARLAALEQGERCLATASGMSAILSTCLALLRSGDHIVCSHSVFGTTVSLFNNILAKFGVETTFVALTDITSWRRAIKPNTRLLFLETPSNPLSEIADLSELAALAHANGCLLVVDNCFCTPALQRPLTLGADIVIHSATKYLDGQGRCVGGAVVASAELIDEKLFPFLRTAGPSMSPFNAWVFLKGLETQSLRMQRHCRNAAVVAAWLARHERVVRVYHLSLPSHPQHALARSQQDDFGGIVSFEVAGGKPAAWRVIDRVGLFSITANLGDTKSLITHPATTTHGRITQAERDRMGIGDGLIRLSIGLEEADDLIRDLDQALSG
jgi:O-succinylhomoserine sulfhydrylase